MNSKSDELGILLMLIGSCHIFPHLTKSFFQHSKF